MSIQRLDHLFFGSLVSAGLKSRQRAADYSKWDKFAQLNLASTYSIRRLSLQQFH